MTSHWDEFSKSLAEPLPRRESLRRLGFVLTGAVLSPLGLGTAWAGGPNRCKTFCNQCPRSQRSQCVDACRACNNDPTRLCGACGTYACCGNGTVCCGDYCADLEGDPYNCGACGYVCEEPDPWEVGACLFGECWYQCAEGAVACDGVCTSLDWDPYNCGACGNVCPESTPYCNYGVCEACPEGTTDCSGYCVDVAYDPFNCGACGVECAAGEECHDGVCYTYPGDGEACTPDHPYYPAC